MSGERIQIRDTGKIKPDGSTVYDRVNSGEWLTLYGRRLSGDFNVKMTDNMGQVEDPSDDSKLTFQNDEVTAIETPVFTIKDDLYATDTDIISNLIKMQRSKGIKELKGGLGLISAISNTDNDSVFINIDSIKFEEVYKTSTNTISVKITVEQVR